MTARRMTTMASAVVLTLGLAVGLAGLQVLWAADGSPLVEITLDSLMAAYPLKEGTASKSAEVGRLEGSSVHYLVTKSTVRAHFHRGRDEVVYVVQGKATVTLGTPGALAGTDPAPSARQAMSGARRVQVRQGSVLLIPRGTAHQVEVIGQQPLVAMSVFSPPFSDNDRVFLSE